MSNVKAIGKINILKYSILAFPLAFVGMPLYVHAPDFYASSGRISLSLIGVILIFTRLLDAFTDPLIGVLSDKYNHYRKTILFIATIILGCGFFLLFSPSIQNKLLIEYWFAITLTLTTLAFSVITINYNTIGGLWAQTGSNSTKLTSIREALGLFGLICAVILPTLLINDYGINSAYSYFSVIFICILLFTSIIFFKNYPLHKEIKNKTYTTDKYKIFSIIIYNKNFFGTYFLSFLSSSIPAVLVLIFIRDIIGAEKYSGFFLMIYFLSAACAIPFWKYLSDKFGKSTIWAAAMLLAILSFIWTFFLDNGDIYSYGIICFFSGVAFSAELILPPAILSETIESKNDESSATTYFSIITFFMKISLALSAGISLPLLDFYGLKTNQSNSEQTLFILSICYAIIPCVLKLISFLILLKQIITQQKIGLTLTRKNHV